MNALFEFQRYIAVLFMVIAFGIVFSWPSRLGKRILCCAIFLQLAELVMWRVFALSVNSFGVPYDSLSIMILRGSALATNVAWNVLLVAYLIRVWRPTRTTGIVDGANQTRSVQLKLPSDELRSILQKREWTYVLDVTFLSFFSTVLVIGIAVVLALTGSSESASFGIAMFVNVGITLTFWFLKEAFYGKSPGKALTGLQVVDAETGLPIGVVQSFIRNWIFLVPFGPIIELIAANVREDKRRLGDLMANTIVVRSGSTQPTAINTSKFAIADQPSTPLRNTCLTADRFIQFSCPACCKKLRVPAKVAGKRGKCRCGNRIVVPSLSP